MKILIELDLKNSNYYGDKKPNEIPPELLWEDLKKGLIRELESNVHFAYVEKYKILEVRNS